MALNPYFLQGTTGEQNLLQDLINEHLTIFGIEVHYLPRSIFRTDNILQEVESSAFQDNFVLEAYICLLYTSPSPRDKRQSRMPSSA